MVVLNLPMLRLSSAEKDLEQLYRQHVNKSCLNIDRSLCTFKLVITAFCVAGMLVGAVPASSSGLAAWISYMLALALHATLQQQQPGYYAASRGWLVLVFKLLLAALLMSLVVTCVLEPIHSVGSYVKVLLLGSGIVMLNCTGG
eukprot:GHRQ01010553.1.p1 GENE.GHRQ01010553.1~~GHRQ01010553.1.p1  ORF type:complete len:144 (-),score=38.16 GHRQ01010553.1:251-682(-)